LVLYSLVVIETLFLRAWPFGIDAETNRPAFDDPASLRFSAGVALRQKLDGLFAIRAA
jgi:hypothetical protein